MARSRSEELEELQIWSLGLNTIMADKSKHEHADLAWAINKRMWLKTEPSSLSNWVSSLVAQH